MAGFMEGEGRRALLGQQANISKLFNKIGTCQHPQGPNLPFPSLTAFSLDIMPAYCQTTFGVYNNKIQMQKQTGETHWLPFARHYATTKETLSSIDKKLQSDKQISKDKKENYVRVIKEMNYNIGKLIDRWPVEIDKMMDNLNSILKEFDNQIAAMNKGSSLFCGSGGNPKQLESTFKRLAGYEHIFEVIRPFQDKQIREDIVNLYEEERNKGENSRRSTRKELSSEKEMVIETKPVATRTTVEEVKSSEKCKNCELMTAVSLCPNGYIAKKLIKELPDTEWIAGILHQEGTIVDKDLDKAIDYYKQAYKKKNYEALYRLGSLNQRGLYGKPFEYLKMWEQASSNGHLQALTDMGYLYEYGLEDQESNRTILEPNFDKAYNYYKKAAEKNFPRALNNLATFFFSNQKYKNQKKCLEYLELASEAEYVKSLHNLGLIYYQGKLVKYDEVKSRNLIRRAAQKGDIEGRIMYVELLLSDIHSCTEDQLAEINRYCREIIAKDQENAQAYYFLGVMYEQGYGVQKQPKTAFLYYTIAANMKNQAALLKLGECYKTGFGTEQDLREAIRYYEQAAQQNKEALISLGEIYEKGGADVNQNVERAFNYYYQACNYGLPEAYKHLGNMYKHGRHVKKNDAKADEYFQKANNIEKQSGIKKLNSSNSQLIQSSYYRRR